MFVFKKKLFIIKTKPNVNEQNNCGQCAPTPATVFLKAGFLKL